MSSALPMHPQGDPGSPICRWCGTGKPRIRPGSDVLACPACDVPAPPGEERSHP